MNSKSVQSKMSFNLMPLSKKEQTDVKGGLLLYCEEKRQSFLGISYTSTQWKLKSDGSLLLSVKM
jgi:hypothetical protein